MLNKLISILDEINNFPIKTKDVADIIIGLGYQDEIYFVPYSADNEKLRGGFYRYIDRRKVYGEPVWVANVYYSNTIGLNMQRLVCCKELVHLCTSKQFRTVTHEQVNSLIPELSSLIRSHMNGDEYESGNHSMSDYHAVYLAVAILFPKIARCLAKKEYECGNLTYNDISKLFHIPEGCVKLAFDPNFDGYVEHLVQTLSGFFNI